MSSDAVVMSDGGFVLGGAFSGELLVDTSDQGTMSLVAHPAGPDGRLIGNSHRGELRFAAALVRGAGRGAVNALAEPRGTLLGGGPFEGPTDLAFGEGRIDDVPGRGAFLMKLSVPTCSLSAPTLP
jgi:hypothetical protein